jgi:RNA polymerase sigma-70 factor (ECF subfamily)
MDCLMPSCGDLESATEDTLVKLAKGRDAAAFCELVRRSRDRCLVIAISILSNRDDALDEVDSAFCKAFACIESLANEARFSSWISRIVRNYCLTRVRRARMARLVPYEALNEDGDSYIVYEPRTFETPELQVGRLEVNRILHSELALIPRSLRVPLELRYFHNMALQDIARDLSLTESAIKSRLHRAHEYLRRRMIRHCGSRGMGTLTRVA